MKISHLLLTLILMASLILMNNDIYAQQPLKGEIVSGPASGPVYKPSFTAPKGPKKCIAVADFENKTNWQGQWALGSGMTEQLITALIRTNMFNVLERQEIKGILEEQDFGQSGRTTKEGGAKVGEIQRAQIMIKGAVTEFAENTKDNAGGVQIKGFTLGGASSEARVSVDIRIYDTTTSQILDSQTCTGIAKASGMAISYTDRDWGIGGANFEKTPLGQATRQAIEQAINFIAMKMQNVRWSGKVITVNKDGIIFINAGKDSNIMLRDQFNVYNPGEALVDPDTGVTLGSEEKLIGKLEVIDVQDKFSKATKISGTGFQRGDIIRYE